MERLCVRVQQQVCMLRGIGEMEEIQAAKQVLKEARNSRAVSDVKYMSRGFALSSLLVFLVHWHRVQMNPIFLLLQALPFTV